MKKSRQSLVGAMLSILLLASAPAAAETGESSFFTDWQKRAADAKEHQPHWASPLVTTTPTLGQQYRYDQAFINKPAGATLESYGYGKGLELIPSENTQLILGMPAYQEQETLTSKLTGFTDASLLLKYRLLAANEENGNFILTGFIATTLPTGGSAFTYGRPIPTATLAVGKGWGTRKQGFDIQSTLGYALADDTRKKTGQPVTWNMVFQAHVFEKLWPEIETHYTHFTDGPWSGKNQAVVTYGANVGRFDLTDKLHLTVGAGYQQTVSSFHATTDSGWIMTSRFAF